MEPATAAAATTTVKNIRDLNWDTPYRYLASALALATWAGGSTPLADLANVAAWVQLRPVADWLCNADTWAHANLSAANTTFALLLAMCVLVNVTKSDIVAESRAMSTAWILFAGLAYCPPVAWGFWLLLGVGIAGFHLARGDRHRRVAGLCEWMIQSIVNLVVAAVWLPLSLLLWALTPARLYKSA